MGAEINAAAIQLVALSSDSCFLLYLLAVEEEYLWAEHCCCSGRSYIDTTTYKDNIIGTRYQNRGDAVLSHNYDESVFASGAHLLRASQIMAHE